jgi:hypothetical protein
MDLPDEDVVWSSDGSYGVTSLARTVFDICTSEKLETAVAVADAALRQAAQHGTSRRLDLEAAEVLRQDLDARAVAAPGRRNIRRARFIIAFADARADGPGESASRLYLRWLGFPPPDLQVPIPGPHGETYEVDFGLGSAWGEFDGAFKYTDPRFLRGRTPERALADEKEREDWIRGTTGKSFARWQDPHMPDAAALGRRLAAFGIAPPRPSAHPFFE